MPDPARVSGAAKAAAARLRFLAFRVGERRYALPAQDIIEVIRMPRMARVPQAPQALLGVGNLRGNVLPVAGLRVLLGMDDTPQPESARALIIDVGGPIALAVDAVQALVEIAPERLETRPAELGALPGEMLRGAFHTDGGEAVKVPDVGALLVGAFAQRTRRQPPAAMGTIGTMGAAATGTRLTTGVDAGRLVTFDVANQEFALEAAEVQEILPVPALPAALPRMDAPVLGMSTLRGALLPLLSLRGLLGFPAALEASGREKVIVAHIGGTRVGLVADRARAVLAVEPQWMDPVPAVLRARAGGEARIKAVYRGEAGKRLISILAADQLFREDVMQRLLAMQDGAVAQSGEGKRADRVERAFLVFRLGGDEFGLPIEAVDEVAQMPDQITRVPKTPKFLEGVINLRGEVLPVVDQRRRFDMPAASDTRGRRLVITRTEHHRAALIVDAVSDVLRVTPQAVEPAPHLTDDTSRLIGGVINLTHSGRMILLLDPAELLTRAEQGLLDTFQAKQRQAPT